MNFRKLPLLLGLILIVSCGNKKETLEDKSNPDQFQSIVINRNPPELKFADLIEKVEVVKLEETEESLLGVIFNLTIHNDLIVIPNTKSNSLYFFNRKGEFIRQLNRNGDGPEEYSSLWSYWLKGDTVKIYDNDRSRVVSYDFEGEYLSELKLPKNATHVYENESGYWTDYSHRFTGDSTNYELVRYNHNMQEPIEFLPFNQPFGFPIVTTTNSMIPYKDALVYKQILNDSTYLIEGAGIKPFIHFDFGADFLWRDEKVLNNPSIAMNEIRDANKVWMIWPKIGEQLIYLTYNTSFEDSFQMVIDRATGKQFSLDTRKNAEEKLGLMFDQWLGNNTMLIPINSLDLAELLEDLDESQYSFREGSSLDVIESSENPALMWVKFKKSLK